MRTPTLLLTLAATLAAALAGHGAPPDLSKSGAVLIAQEGSAPEDLEIARTQQRIRALGPSADNLERLGWAFVDKHRASQDPGFLTLAGLVADQLATTGNATDAAHLLRGHVLHQQHRFSEAAAIARDLASRRGSWTDHALLGDVLLEVGDLAGAGAAYDRVGRLRPGVQAYARAAHWRWLQGDLPGALAAARLATRSAGPRDPVTHAWTLVRRSTLELAAGDATAAEASAAAAREVAPAFGLAWWAHARSRLAAGDAADAARSLATAAGLAPLPEIDWWLIEALEASGRTTEAAEAAAAFLRRAPAEDARTASLFLATRGIDAAHAVALAREQFSRRQDIHSADALAWALLAAGDTAAATPLAARATATGCVDARILWHAAEVARAGGDLSRAASLAQQASTAAGMLLPGERTRLAALVAALGPAMAGARSAPLPAR